MGLGANWMYLFYINALWCSTAIIHCNKSEVRRLILDNNWLNKTYEMIDNVYGRKWEINVREKRKVQSRMDNLKTQAVLGTQDTRWRKQMYGYRYTIIDLISQSNIISNVKSEMWDVIKNPFRAKHIYRGVYNVTSLQRHIRKQQYYVDIPLVAC